jgi:alkanesulfonate monooxygenase SsuD/methylene tetrahydromethanopterin reductase-like flavin-dependent oxidoreductase (luciferase family)
MTRRQFDTSTALRGANLVGSPHEVAEKILFQHEIFGHRRTLIQFSVGTLPHAAIMRAIELYGTEVAPVVREEVARRTATSAAANG